MMRADTVVEIREGCTACGACISTCPTRALLPAPYRPYVVESRCNLCLECLEICPRGVIYAPKQTEDLLAGGTLAELSRAEP